MMVTKSIFQIDFLGIISQGLDTVRIEKLIAKLIGVDFMDHKERKKERRRGERERESDVEREREREI